MCAIIGYYAIKPENSYNWLEDARDLMSHRGPDDKGVWFSNDRSVGLAHRRLSILDISYAGHQPMISHDAQVTLVFNGEIYNFLEIKKNLVSLGHHFKSNSDTEVILNSYIEWGEDCIHRFNGMFSIAIYDNREKKIFLARDRAGEKPLYYKIDKGYIYFASELKALLNHPDIDKKLDYSGADYYLYMGYVPGNSCIVEGINKLPAAHALSFNISNGSERIWRYWKIPDYQPVNENQLLIEELDNLLENSVKKQLVADVPVGVLLSGGLDSSLVTAMAVRHSSKVKTFSIGFPGYGNLDETEYSNQISKYFDTDHTNLVADETSADLIPKLAIQFDEPIVDSSMIPTWLVSSLVKNYCTVSLGGDGADELFGGYEKYRRFAWINKNAKSIPKSVRIIVSKIFRDYIGWEFKGKSYLSNLNKSINDSLPDYGCFFDAKSRNNIFPELKNNQKRAEQKFEENIPNSFDPIDRMLRMDFMNYLVEDILVKVDRASMLNSIEMRSPFLDQKIIEFAFSKVPTCLKASSTNKKILLKELGKIILPNDFNLDRKQGFSIPLTEWLKTGPYKELVMDTLNSNCIFNVDEILNKMNSGKLYNRDSERIFALTLFELWRNYYKITL